MEDPLAEQALENEREGADALHEVETVGRKAFPEKILGLLAAPATDGEHLDRIACAVLHRVAEPYAAIRGAVRNVDDHPPPLALLPEQSGRHDRLSGGGSARGDDCVEFTAMV